MSVYGAQIVLENAKKWAEEFWGNVIDPWTQRPPQDYVYRRLIVEPALTKLISECNFKPLSLVVEIGCGDGAHSIFWRRSLNDFGLDSVRIIGVDLFKSLVIQAHKNALDYDNISFLVGDVTTRRTADTIHEKAGVPDLIVAMFLLQDLPDLTGLLEMVKTCLRDGGHFIAVFVHPDFAEQLMAAKLIGRPAERSLHEKCITESGLVQWRSIGGYPIAREDAPPFYLPYFHRTLADYYKAFDYLGFDVIDRIPLGPDTRLWDGESTPREPFCQTRWNIYWPYISTGPSSMLIHAVKRQNGLQWQTENLYTETQSALGSSRPSVLKDDNHIRKVNVVHHHL